MNLLESMGVARRLLCMQPVGKCALLVALLASGCVIPIGVDLTTSDGAVNCAPQILATNPDFHTTNITFDSSNPPSITVTDCEGPETLYVRVFRDYPAPFVEQDQVPLGASGATAVLVFRNVANWCVGASSGAHMFEVFVADTAFNDDGTPPPYQAILPGGKSDSRTWNALCQ